MRPVSRILLSLGTLASIAGAQAPTATATDANAVSPRPWTFLIYGACDNNAEVDGNFFAFLDGVRAALADDCGVDVVLLLDRADGYSTNAESLGEDFTDARLYHVRGKSAERLAGGEHFPEIALDSSYEPDSADPENVRKLIAFGKARFPAQHYALMLYGHADGRAMCPDEQSQREMGFAALTEVVGAGEAVDLMALELCTMGGIEVAYQWRPGNGGFSTEVLVAIPNAGPAMDWGRAFARLRRQGTVPEGFAFADPSSLTAPDLGRLIVEECGAARHEAGQEREAIGCYDLTRAAAVKAATDALAVALAAAGAGAKDVFEELRGPGPDGYALNYARNRLARAPFVDLHDLSRRAAACERLDDAVRRAAAAVAERVDAFVLASWGGERLRRFEPGASGVYVTFPDGDAIAGEGGRIWSTCRWYSPLPVEGVYGKLAWCRDGATPGNGVVENWFELLDSWFDDVSAKPEGTNGYAN